MAEWYSEPADANGYDWGAPGPSKDFAPLKERNDFAEDSGELRDDSCRKYVPKDLHAIISLCSLSIK